MLIYANHIGNVVCMHIAQRKSLECIYTPKTKILMPETCFKQQLYAIKFDNYA